MDRTTTTTDSLGIVTLAIEAFKRGHLTEAQLQTINNCADDFARVLSLANKYRELTGKSLALDDLPPPTTLRTHLELESFDAALWEASRIQSHMRTLFQRAQQQLGHLGIRLEGAWRQPDR